MREIFDYTIITVWSNEGPGPVVELVEDAMREGWEPLGPVSVNYHPGTEITEYNQTMVKYEPEVL